MGVAQMKGGTVRTDAKSGPKSKLKKFDLVVSDRVWHDRQSGNRAMVVRLGTAMLRARVHHDASYDFQSWAKIEVWANGWQEVHFIPGQAVTTRHSGAVETARSGDFDDDVNELFRVAEVVLGLP
jgi:hypothetical protein